ncbi:MAG: hypothetical protein DI596_14500 [Azospira oryzae]|nr:MAG: hypothetical protein DI596_14500 [Azospira oryzae]PZP75854.1 MAG: hypothetical protein DI593_14500 [Azospira oryzae]
MFETFGRRAQGKRWENAVQPGSRKHKKDFEIIDAVERARAKGLKTSRDGDPGEAFEEAAKELGIKSSFTARDNYYKLKQKGFVDAYKISGELAREILHPSRKDS